MIIQLAGLPGTGKSTLGTALHQHLAPDTLILSKDIVRAALYEASGHVDYSMEQDDFVVGLLHQAAGKYLAHAREAVVILERTCTRTYQIEAVRALAAELDQPLAIIECICPAPIAHLRLKHDQHSGRHPAANRDRALYERLAASADVIQPPKLRLRTDREPEAILAETLAYIRSLAEPPHEAQESSR